MKINNNMYIDDERKNVMSKLAPSRKQMENYRVIADVVAKECGAADKRDKSGKNDGIKN